MTSKILKGLFGAAGALALVVSVSGVAQAQEGVIAEAILNVTSFQFENPDDGGAVYDVTELTVEGGGNVAAPSASLDSVAGTETDTDSAAITAAEGFGEIDLDNVCQGDCPATGDNNFTTINNTVLPDPTGHFAQADQLLEGAALDTFGTIQTGADAFTAARSSLESSDEGTATANTGTETTIHFVATVGGTLDITLDYELFLMAYVDEETSLSLSEAIARSSWSITLFDEDTQTLVLDEAPGVLNTTVSRNDFNAQFNELSLVDISGSLSFTGITLVAGHFYTLTVTHEVFADTRLTIPEPTTVMLFGAGLLGMAFFGFTYRRRSLPMA